MATKFNVNYAVGSDELQGKTVLVFLKPQNPQSDYRIHAWQVLTGSAGATESFDYEAAISTDVTSVISGNQIVSGRQSVVPGQLLSARSPDALSPLLEPAPTSLAQTKLTPQQCGVINQTNPYIQFDSNWYVNDKPVVTMPYVDINMTARFEHQSNGIYFMMAPPPMPGQTYVVQNFSDMTQYVMPIMANEVDVSVTRDHGLWTFYFSAR